ncbi:hypothetical protein HNP84_003628 [Thermocatellispora tengchongensis]|uniref:Activator of Hsp90 ATPase homologue 1/2-like C-terminal domain-containing protein n=1 Tax=Thermocatellispora tengchongensis TaxID=1073253 RepID=A0A840P3F4_9ACTN|nr:SRPBCC domain-containing protein [Thermocatellispora tengchongensis]MBB5133902.1 hypothetical protein [Thermocatellispora tengchongensis]
MTTPKAEPATEPLRSSVLVRSDREHVYDVFVREIGHWWPTRPLSLGGGRVTAVTVEPRLGGRVYEVWRDGTEVDWGEILVWEPPERFAMTWEPTALTADPEDPADLPEEAPVRRVEGGAVTEVELRFQELGPALTRVEVEHRGWERLSHELACAYPPGYAAGWHMLLTRLAAHATGAPLPPPPPAD